MIYYKNKDGEFVPLEEGRSQIKVGGLWVDTEYYFKFREFALSAKVDVGDESYVPVPVSESELEEAFLAMHKEKLITEQFLLSTGWIKRGKRRYQFGETANFLKALNEFGTSEENMLEIYEDGLDKTTMYFGLLPTESEFETLRKLLEI
jgi:hypothetical protein